LSRLRLGNLAYGLKISLHCKPVNIIWEVICCSGLEIVECNALPYEPYIGHRAAQKETHQVSPSSTWCVSSGYTSLKSIPCCFEELIE
jgi:hypothetical protein